MYTFMCKYILLIFVLYICICTCMYYMLYMLKKPMWSMYTQI